MAEGGRKPISFDVRQGRDGPVDAPDADAPAPAWRGREQRLWCAAMTERNITWHHGEVSREDRRRVHGHRGATLWLTGLSGSGKSTVAHRVERKLLERGCFAYVLDGDNVRHGLNQDLDFSRNFMPESLARTAALTQPKSTAVQLRVCSPEKM